MYLAGFSINVLSMLAIVLSVGLVVDDAIVMTENIYIRIERGMEPKERRYRRGEGDILCSNLDHHHAGSRVLPHRVYGWNDGTTLPRVQYGYHRIGHHLFVCRTYRSPRCSLPNCWFDGKRKTGFTAKPNLSSKA